MNDHQPFEAIKQIGDSGMEFWSSRALSKLLEYSEYRRFTPVLARAREAYTNSGQSAQDHFEEILAMVKIGSGAQQSGVETALDFAVFQNHGYQGLYGGLDHMGSTELAANLFRATQTEEKLRRDEVSTKQRANQTHYEVGQKVRQTIKDLGGTMPESLHSPDKSIQQLEIAAKGKDTPDS
ncbi:hypothetical protein ACM26S_13740 [Kluyvera sichuanensis]|uniref:hypothetical protein n=1 Tax=Kluyvera sichuanensis TaxID=2725494 RepID=UPI0039F6A9BA